MKALLQEGGCDDTYQKHHFKSQIGKEVNKKALLRKGSEGHQKQKICIFLVELEVPREGYLAGISGCMGKDAGEPWRVGTNSQGPTMPHLWGSLQRAYRH